MAHIIQCDSCKEIETEGENVIGWVELSYVDHMSMLASDAIFLPVTFCSLKCFRAWVTSVHIEEQKKRVK